MPGFSNISYSKHANTKKANFFVSSPFILKITVQQSASDIGESILRIWLRNIGFKRVNFNFWQLSPISIFMGAPGRPNENITVTLYFFNKTD